MLGYVMDILVGVQSSTPEDMAMGIEEALEIIDRAYQLLDSALRDLASGKVESAKKKIEDALEGEY